MILVVSHPGDDHARAVMALLRRWGARPVLLDLARFPREARIAMTWDGRRARDVHLAFGRGLSLRARDVEAVWWRRPGRFEPHPRVQRSRREFVFREYTAAFEGLWLGLDARWVNHPARDEAASRKPWQLTQAQRLGLAVPRTLVTNDPARARAFARSCRPGGTVYKALSATPSDWRETRLVRRQELARLGLVRYAPIIFQEYVEGTDVRATLVGRRIFAAAVHAEETDYPADFRVVFDRARVEPVALPAPVERRLMRLAGALGLAYAAFDLRRRPDGRYVFLEVNPSGQWLFVERRTGQPITEAVALLLARGR